MPLTVAEAIAKYPQMAMELRRVPGPTMRVIEQWEAEAAAGGLPFEERHAQELAGARARRRGVLTLGLGALAGIVTGGISAAAQRARAQTAMQATLAPVPDFPTGVRPEQWEFAGVLPPLDIAPAALAPRTGFFPGLVRQVTGLLPTGLRLPSIPAVARVAPALGVGAPAAAPSLWSRFWSFAGAAAPTVIQALGIGGGAALAGAGVGVGAAAAGVGVGGAALRVAAPAALPALAPQAALPAPAVGAPSPGIDWDMIYLMR